MAENVWINEIDYFKGNSESTNRYVEIVGEAGINLSGWKLYDFINTAIVASYTFTGAVLTDQGSGFGHLRAEMNLNDGHRETGLALVDPDGNVVQLLGYGTGTVTVEPQSPFAGMKVEFITPAGVNEYGQSGTSVALVGTGNKYSDFHWARSTRSPDATNGNQTLTSPNDPPVLTGNLSGELDEGGIYQLTTAELFYSDPDDGAGGVTFIVSALSHGTIEVNGTTAKTFTGQDIADGHVVFVHDGDESASASFDVSLDDGNEDGSNPSLSTFNFVIDPVNDPAVFTGDLAGTVTEHLNLTVSGKVFVSDPDGNGDFAAFQGSYGAFALKLGTGDWTYTLDDRNKKVAALNAGQMLTDHIQLQAADGTTSDIAITILGSTDITGTNGNDKGKSGLVGDAHGDFIHGLKGNDEVYGSAGDDYVYGDAGNDKLYGDDAQAIQGEGDDVLTGGTGKDLFWGGGGADRFVFANGDSTLKSSGRDIIKDFDHKDDDLIDLALIDANAKTGKDDAFKIYGTEKAALAHLGGLFIEKDGQHQIVYMNTDSKSGFEMAIEVDASKVLVVGDFSL